MTFHHLQGHWGRGVVIAMALLATLHLSACATHLAPLSDAEQQALMSVGADAKRIQALLDAPANEKIDAMLVFKDGHMVLERYGNGYDRDKLHDIRSSTKAITGLLVGIAIDQGLIQSVNESILSYFPERQATHPEFAPIRIVDLLTMRSGLNANDWDAKSPGNEERMYKTDSWIDFFFDLEPVHAPGERFSYSTAGVVLLGELLARATGMPYAEFAHRYLFEPLGILDYSFAATPAAEADAGGHLKIRPVDFAKLGLLMMNGGVWGDQRIVSEEWVAESITPRVRIPQAPQTGPYMGYLWWQEPVDSGLVRSFQSRGNGGQYLIAVPHAGLLGVFTGSAYNSPKQYQPFLLMKDYLIPAFTTEQPTNSVD
nr:serine hydrolase [Oceanococcus sp. HetDA_MAG_MS8]